MLISGEMIWIPSDVFPTDLHVSLFPSRGTNDAFGSTTRGSHTFGGLTDSDDDDMVPGVD